MSTIIIENLGQKIEAQPGETVLQAAWRHEIDWMAMCGGKGRCVTCMFTVRAFTAELPPLTDREKAYSDRKLLPENHRLACQCVPKGDLVVKIPKDYQLPHQQYS